MDSPGDIGPVGQANQSNAAAAATGGGTSDASSAGTGVASGDPTATSSAQSEQTTASNTNLDVRVASPGDAASVNQANTTQAGAASTSAIGSGDSANGAAASASAAQVTPGNVNVVIRVGSPGDNGSVTEQNSVGATAGPSLPPQTVTSGAPQSGAFGTDQVVTTSGSANVTNTGALDQELEQLQTGDGPSNQAADGRIGPAAAPTSVSSTGTASVEQTGAANTNVSVRIASPGSDGAVTQANNAAATGTSRDLGVVVATEGANTNVSVVIPGTVAGAPDTGPWVWNWVWNGSWTPPDVASASDVAPTDTSAWNWVWQSPTSDPPPASPPDAGTTGPGMWTWDWTWTGTDGQTWTGSWQQPCDCSWTWTWTWDWSGGVSSFAPADATTADSAPQGSGATAPAAATTDIGAISQSNSAASTASASVETSALQSFDQSQIAADPTGAENQSITAEQTLLSSQDALAAAEADQADAWNLISLRGEGTGTVSQRNSVSAAALADVAATIVQGTVQHQISDRAAVQSASATQWLASAQSAVAAAEATQTDARNFDVVSGGAPNEAWIAPVEQTNSASATAAAAVSADLEQWIGQFQNAGLAIAQGADATQLLGSSQTAAAAAVVAQTSTWNRNDVVVPAGSRATNPSLRQQNLVYTTTSATDSAGVPQWILQVQDGIADVELSSASQEAGSSQSALAYSPAEQTRLLNSAGWLGIEPAAATPGPGAATLASTTAAGASLFLIGPGSISMLSPAPFLSPRLGGLGPIAAGAVTALRTGAPVPGSAGAPAEDAAAGTATRIVGVDARGAKASRDEKSGTAPGGIAFDLMSGGAAGSASSGGAGAGFALAGRPFKLVAPAHLGPLTSAPTLGRSVDFLEFLERPG